MSDFTYEANDTSKKLEVYEWDNVWWEHTENKTAKRILYIGDSISCITRRFVTRLSNEEILCDGFGTSKALDNPFFKLSLELFMNQQNEINAILFNNGLHGWHLSKEEYKKYYEEMLLFLLQAKKTIFILLTTDVINDENRNEEVNARNEIAKELAKKYGLSVIDLNTVAVNNRDCHHEDGVHFNTQGYEHLAKCILDHIR